MDRDIADVAGSGAAEMVTCVGIGRGGSVDVTHFAYYLVVSLTKGPLCVYLCVFCVYVCVLEVLEERNRDEREGEVCVSLANGQRQAEPVIELHILLLFLVPFHFHGNLFWLPQQIDLPIASVSVSVCDL